MPHNDAALTLVALNRFCWGYATVLAVIWMHTVGRSDARDQIGHFVGLIGIFVPGMALSLLTLMSGSIVGTS